jgi:hypothetical protein
METTKPAAAAPLRTVLHTYAFDTDKPEQLAQWRELKAKLRTGPRSMCSHGGALHVTAAATLGAKHTGGTFQSIPVTLDTVNLFNNQWNATGPNGVSYRVFDWAIDSAYALDPKGKSKRKQGHWLEQTPEMVAIRDNTLVCGYCRRKAPRDTAGVFCHKCLGSANLEEADLFLLRMLPVSSTEDRPHLTLSEFEELQALYNIAQLRAPVSDAKANEGVNAAIAKLEHAQREAAGWRFIRDVGLPTSNLICYDTKGRAQFTWGWQRAYTPALAAALAARLEGFPASWEIEATNGRITGGLK